MSVSVTLLEISCKINSIAIEGIAQFAGGIDGDLVVAGADLPDLIIVSGTRYLQTIDVDGRVFGPVIGDHGLGSGVLRVGGVGHLAIIQIHGDLQIVGDLNKAGAVVAFPIEGAIVKTSSMPSG